MFDYGGLRMLHVGDNGLISAEVADALKPIDDKEHILSTDEVQLIRKRLAPRVTVPMHYRLDDLELNPDRPRDLGNINGYLAVEALAKKLSGHCAEVSKADIPLMPEVWVFQHHPDVVSESE